MRTGEAIESTDGPCGASRLASQGRTDHTAALAAPQLAKRVKHGRTTRRLLRLNTRALDLGLKIYDPDIVIISSVVSQLLCVLSALWPVSQKK